MHQNSIIFPVPCPFALWRDAHLARSNFSAGPRDVARSESGELSSGGYRSSTFCAEGAKLMDDVHLRRGPYGQNRHFSASKFMA